MKVIDTPIHKLELLYRLRTWERENLPICRTNAGYHLFLCLSHRIVLDECLRLKNLYHSLPFSEKTLRLLLRELESDGWIEMPNKVIDSRHKDVIPTTKLNSILREWSAEIDSIFYKS